MASLQDKRAMRFAFLKALYDKTEGDSSSITNLYEIGDRAGLDRETTAKVTEYLRQEGLMKHVAQGGSISITHYGVKTIEEALQEPETATQYFPPVINITNVNNMIASSIQQAGAGATLTASVSREESLEIKTALANIQAKAVQLNIDGPSLNELTVSIQTTLAQLESARPKRSIILECLATVRNVLEGAAGSTIAAQLLPPILALIARM